MSSFICPLCTTNRDFVNFFKLFRHITLYHQSDPNFEIKCDLHNTCGVFYKKYSAYKSHVYRKHSTELHSSANGNTSIDAISIDNSQLNNFDTTTATEFANDDESTESTDACDETDSILSNDNDAISYFSSDRNEEIVGSIKDIKNSFVMFILQLREEFLLPKNVTNIISTYITSLINHIEILLQEKTFDFSGNSPLSASLIPRSDFGKCIDFNQLKLVFDDVCNGIELITKNEYQFTKYCEEYFNFTSPLEIPVSSVPGDTDCGYFIPIDNSLSSMLESQQFSDEILENIHQKQTITELDKDLMFSIRDSYHGLGLDDNHLLIQLYIDDIGLTNPLGSKRDRHKMSMVYFTLEDIPEKYRSKLDFIQLVAICESRILKQICFVTCLEYIRTFGLFEDPVKATNFFRPIIDNLNELQLNGLMINNTLYKFTFSTVVGDNLAANWLGGFQTCFSNGHFCRRCYIDYKDQSLLIPLSQIKLRTMFDHDLIVQQILNDPNRSPVKGVVGQSPLHSLIGFHPTTSLPADCMHDLLEGICPIVMMSLLKEASSKRLITHGRIQERTTNFQYGYFDCANRPPPIQTKHLQNERIVATAAQKLCLFKTFPFIFWDIVDRLESFIVYKILREILDLVLSYPFRTSWLSVLDDLCDAFHHLMLIHFPNKIVPKIHFVREYGRVVRDYGPATRHWCFRTNNFKNTPKMLATHFRFKQCYKFSRFSPLRNTCYPVGVKTVRNSSLNKEMRDLVFNHFGCFDFEENLFQCRKLINENIEYRQSAVYVMGLRDTDEQPSFAQLVFILRTSEKWWLLVDSLETKSFDEDLFAWEIKSVDRYSLMDPCQLKYWHKGLDIYHVKGSSFVSFTARLTLY
ncbi:unnamed protein product [Adineta ricciae]|uniref:C2H2-type domain-containing protein n=1 Tax=Adineta ricciae TaxID=249248 RepID=A0A814S6X9_ADIRI|nr:unnamed protein product [Adineta ricciae]